MSEIFLSYEKSDRKRAKQLAEALETQGWSVWWDRKIGAGGRFRKIIGEAIDDSQCLVVVWSAASVESSWVLDEAEIGNSRGMLVPVSFDRQTPPMGFRQVQVADLSRWEGDYQDSEFKSLCAEIERRLSTPEEPPEPAPELEPKVESKRTSLPETPIPKNEPRKRSLNTIRERFFVALAIGLGLFLGVRGLSYFFDSAGDAQVAGSLQGTEGSDETGVMDNPPGTEDSAETALVGSTEGSGETEVVGSAEGSAKTEVVDSLLETESYADTALVGSTQSTEESVKAKLVDSAPIPTPKESTTVITAVSKDNLVAIDGDCFQMGSRKASTSVGFMRSIRRSRELPLHPVCLPRYLIGKYEVTFAEYDIYAKETARDVPDDKGWGREYRPVINVTWNDARDYAKWFGQRIGQQCGLPTETEWEYAARARSITDYPWGEDIGEKRANCADCGSKYGGVKTSSVGSFDPNLLGVYDMHGNVSEWVEDCWHENYDNAPDDGSAWLDADHGECWRRVLRDGSWKHNGVAMRSSYRTTRGPDFSDDFIGFRVACRHH